MLLSDHVYKAEKSCLSLIAGGGMILYFQTTDLS